MSLIKTKNVSLINPKIDIEDFQVSEGDIIHLKGESGVGKSSFLKALTRLKKLSAGTILYNESSDCSAKQIRDLVLYVPQFSGSETMKVSEYIRELMFVNNCLADITSQLDEFGMSGIVNKRVDQISGGERQILNLLIAMSLERKVLLCDESFSVIDPARLELIIKKLLTWRGKSRAVVYISHQVLDLDNHVSAEYIFIKTQGVVRLSKI